MDWLTIGTYGDARGRIHIDVPELARELLDGALLDAPRGVLARAVMNELKRSTGYTPLIIARLQGLPAWKKGTYA